jgi:hypothetical protein
VLPTRCQEVVATLSIFNGGPMSDKTTPPDYNQYGMKDEDVKTKDVYFNRPGGEQRAIGPADAVDASGHRLGEIEDRPDPKPSSRTGQAVIDETDDKKR